MNRHLLHNNLLKKIKKSDLIKYYIDQHLSARKIAVIYNTSHTLIYKFLKKYKISIRTKSDALSGQFGSNYKDGKTLQQKYCIDCGKKIYWRSTRCNICNLHYRNGINHPNWKGGKPKCKICGVILSSIYAEYCQIHVKYHSNKINRTGKNHWNYGRCGQDWPTYGKKRPDMSGKNHPNYIDGLSSEYPLEFNIQLKQQIRQRDNFTCQCCGLIEKKHFRGKKQIKLTIHHIDYNRNNCAK